MSISGNWTGVGGSNPSEPSVEDRARSRAQNLAELRRVVESAIARLEANPRILVEKTYEYAGGLNAGRICALTEVLGLWNRVSAPPIEQAQFRPEGSDTEIRVLRFNPLPCTDALEALDVVVWPYADSITDKMIEAIAKQLRSWVGGVNSQSAWLIGSMDRLLVEIRDTWKGTDRRILDKWGSLEATTGAFEKLASDERQRLWDLTDSFYRLLQHILPLVDISVQQQLLTLPEIARFTDLGKEPGIRSRAWWPKYDDLSKDGDALVERLRFLLGAEMRRKERLARGEGADRTPLHYADEVEPDSAPENNAPTARMKAPGGPTASDLATAVGISDDTFRRVRKAAGIEVTEKGSAARNRRYPPEEVDRLIRAALGGDFQERRRMADQWAKWSSRP